jgi:hypothetical protein
MVIPIIFLVKIIQKHHDYDHTHFSPPKERKVEAYIVWK